MAEDADRLTDRRFPGCLFDGGLWAFNSRVIRCPCGF